MKKILTFLLLGYSIVAFMGCDQIDKVTKSSPKDVIIKYLYANKDGDITESYKYISNQDKSIKSLDQMIKNEKDQDDNPFSPLIIKDTKFKVLSIKEFEDNASVDLEITIPDISILAKETMREALKNGLLNIDPKKSALIILEKYKNKKLPTITKFQTYQMVKEKNNWKVFLNLKAEQEELEKTTKIYILIDEADELKKLKKYQRAILKYKEVLTLDSESVEAKSSIEETKKEVASIKAKQEYIKNVILYDFKAKYYDSYLNKNIPGINFKIKNEGNRTLKKVEVTVYFKNADGNTIAEENYHPVLVSSYGFGDNNKPLKPNYIWQMERGKFYQAKSVPSEWKEGSAMSKITNIEFSDNTSTIKSNVATIDSSDPAIDKVLKGEDQPYIDKIKLYDLKAKYHDTYLDKKVPGVNFKLKNNGDRILKMVQVTIYFKDKNGIVISEKKYHPVLVTSSSFGRDNTPLKPNYIWQMERGKFYKADSVPGEWKVGSVVAKITKIEFQE